MNLFILKIPPESYYNHRCKDSLLYEYPKTNDTDEIAEIINVQADIKCQQKFSWNQLIKRNKEED